MTTEPTQLTEHVAIVILSDGQSWSGLDNSAIAILTRADFDRLIDGEKLTRIQPIMEIGLHDFSLPATERGGA